ncbi:MAG: hypothetical protein JST16_01825 [Bdellovibrionales bacterium]|nr:hypothetical protein [Bdellovibrionales bacterium]
MLRPSRYYLRSSAARQLGSSAARQLGSSAARQLGSSAARQLGSSKTSPPLLKARLFIEFLSFAFLLLGLLPSVAQATPQVIRVDGSVFDSTGSPITASQDIQIKAYDAASGGTLLWTSSVYNTSVSSGRFTINLDAAAGSPSLVDRFGERTASQAIYFQIEVDSGAANGTMDTPTIVLPRIRAKGTAFALNAASADALKGVTATTAEFNRLAGVTANVQSQINTLAAGGSSANKVDKAGDSMSGALQVGANVTSTGTVTAATLNSTGATASRFALFDSSKNLASSASSVTDTEFGYLSGVTANLGASLNGLTANVQTQLNAKATSAALVAKAGDSMSGALQVGANITSTGTVQAATINGTGLTASRALVTDGSKNLSSSSVTDTELGYLSGVTASVQTQFAGKVAINQQCNTGEYLQGFDVSGNKICVALPGNEAFTKVGAGYDFACGVVSNGQLRCWGLNNYGQLGNGSTTASSVPVVPRGSDGAPFSGASEVAGGTEFVCALKTNGTVWCWGYNASGQLGNNSNTSTGVPAQVNGLTSATKISAGYDSACATKTDGTIWCWGNNAWGQLGDGTTTAHNTPVQVSGITTAVWVTGGNSYHCAALGDGSARCWGYNQSNGNLGDGTTTTRTTPVNVIGVSNITKISASKCYAGYCHTCAVKSDGTLWCWGTNAYGELGNGTTTAAYTPVQVSGITTAVLVESAHVGTCAVLSTGDLKCWGYNADGFSIPGDGTGVQRTTPVSVIGPDGNALTGVTALASRDSTPTGYTSVHAVSNGHIYSWGVGSNGILGNNSTSNAPKPVAAHGP